jgi:hypothetical protein
MLLNSIPFTFSQYNKHSLFKFLKVNYCIRNEHCLLKCNQTNNKLKSMLNNALDFLSYSL